MSEGPTRLTVRGGRDQFDWNNVKDDKHYQNYLGHSLKAPVGRWQNNKDLEWFNKAGVSEAEKKAARLEEIKKIKEAEEEAVAAAMGITLPPRQPQEIEPAADRKEAHTTREPRVSERRRHGESKRREARSRSPSRSHRHGRSDDRDRERKHDRRRTDRSRSRDRRPHRSHRDEDRRHGGHRSRD